MEEAKHLFNLVGVVTEAWFAVMRQESMVQIHLLNKLNVLSLVS